MKLRVFALVLVAAALCPSTIVAQQAAPDARAVSLGTLQRSAVEADPRFAQAALLAAQSALRQRTLGAKLPLVSFDALTQYQSDVARAPLLQSSGQPLFAAPHAAYDTSARVEQRLFDPVRQPQVALERAQLAEQQAHVRTALFSLRQQVNDAFFAALGLQERASAIDAAITSLEGRLREVRARVQEGAALPAEAAAVEATLLERQQDVERVRSERQAAVIRLASLTRRRVDEGAVLTVPALSPGVAEARGRTAIRQRPEFAQFADSRSRVARQVDLLTAQQRPRLVAFVRAGYGRPGLNFIADRFDAYGVVGIQMQWRPLTWGAADREREALRLQEQIIEADEAAFAKSIDDALPADLATIEWLQRALATDDRIVELREQVERSARVRLQDGVVTASEYLDRNAELLQARVARAGRRVELARANAHLLTLLGMELP